MKPPVRLIANKNSNRNPYGCARRWIVLLVLVWPLMGCGTYYLVSPQPEIDAAVAEMYAKNDYVILHARDTIVHINHLRLDETKTVITGLPDTVSKEHLNYLTPPKDKRNAYWEKRGDPTIEAHVYAPEFSLKPDTSFAVRLSDIERILFYDPDTKANNSEQLIGFMAIPATLIFLLIIGLESLGA